MIVAAQAGGRRRTGERRDIVVEMAGNATPDNISPPLDLRLTTVRGFRDELSPNK
jgi:hypothetical protein